MSPHATYWKVAMERDYNPLKENHTQVLAPPPLDCKIILCKWVYLVKYTSTWDIDKYKARLVAKGFSQVTSFDYTKSISLVIKHDSIRVVFAIVAVICMHMKQSYIGTTYLNNDHTTVIFMHQPEGPKYPHYVCQFLKKLYGLK